MKKRIDLEYGRALREDQRHPGAVDVFGSNGKVGTHSAPWLFGPGVLVGRKGTVGAVHYSPGPYWPIDTVYYVKSVGDDDLRYLYYLLEFLPLQHLNAATGVPGLSRRDAYALRGAFPPRDEQIAIVRVLDCVSDAIERARTATHRAAEVKRALVQELFARGTRGEPTKKSPVGPIPESWNVVRLDQVVTVFRYGLSVPMHLKGIMPILRMGNIQSGEVIVRDLKYVNLPDHVSGPYLLRRGDVLFNRTNSQEHVGKVGIYRSDVQAVFASYLIRVEPNTDLIDPYYLGQLLNSYPAQCRIKRYATPGVEQVNVNATNLGRVLIPLPTGQAGIEEQREIAGVLEHADDTKRTFQSMVGSLLELRKALVYELLTGKVRVARRELETSLQS